MSYNYIFPSSHGNKGADKWKRATLYGFWRWLPLLLAAYFSNYTLLKCPPVCIKVTFGWCTNRDVFISPHEHFTSLWKSHQTLFLGRTNHFNRLQTGVIINWTAALWGLMCLVMFGRYMLTRQYECMTWQLTLNACILVWIWKVSFFFLCALIWNGTFIYSQDDLF